MSAWKNPGFFDKMADKRMNEIIACLSGFTTERCIAIRSADLQDFFPPLKPKGDCQVENAAREKELRILRATERARVQALLREEKKKEQALVQEEKKKEQALLQEEKKKEKKEKNAAMLKEEQRLMEY